MGGRDPARWDRRARRILRMQLQDAQRRGASARARVFGEGSFTNLAGANPWIGPIEQKIRDEISGDQKNGGEHYAADDEIKIARENCFQ